MYLQNRLTYGSGIAIIWRSSSEPFVYCQLLTSTHTHIHKHTYTHTYTHTNICTIFVHTPSFEDKFWQIKSWEIRIHTFQNIFLQCSNSNSDELGSFSIWKVLIFIICYSTKNKNVCNIRYEKNVIFLDTFWRDTLYQSAFNIWLGS